MEGAHEVPIIVELSESTLSELGCDLLPIAVGKEVVLQDQPIEVAVNAQLDELDGAPHDPQSSPSEKEGHLKAGAIVSTVEHHDGDQPAQPMEESEDSTQAMGMAEASPEREVAKDKTGQWQCTVCGLCLSSKAALNRHGRRHQEATHKCQVCPKVFFEAHDLRVHTEADHMGIRYPCEQPQYGRTFKTNHLLSLHMKEHGGQMKFVCDRCGRGFNRRPHFVGHCNAHTGHKETCSQCGKGFTFATDRQKHETICGQPPRFQCDICKKRFRTKRYLKEHCRSHSSDCEFFCDVCGKAYRHKGSLHNHKKIHS